MKIDFQSQTPIFLQVSQGLEDEILSGIYGEEEQIPSITELSANYKINPATALKGINLLVDDAILEERRKLLVPREPNVKTGWLARYARLVGPANLGAVMQ